jgi:hypothetical protein
MLRFHIVSTNTSPVEEICDLQVRLQITYLGSREKNGLLYVTPEMVNEDEVRFSFSQIRKSLDDAEKRALALLAENRA